MKKYETKVQELDVHRKEIIQMVKNGSSQKEIAEKYETWPSIVRYWFRKRGIKPEVLRGNQKSTGRKCSSCIYRQLNPNLGNCDYICKTGHSRGCSAINCDKYVKGRPIASMKETVEDYDIFDERGRKKKWKTELVRPADTMMIFSAIRKESGSEMTIAAVNGKWNHGSSGEKVC